MYNGDPKFALAVGLVSTAFLVILTDMRLLVFVKILKVTLLKNYKDFITIIIVPITLSMVIGDIDLKTALQEIADNFAHLEPEPSVETRPIIIEPKQEGIRRFAIQRPGTTNILALAVKHPGFPTKGWYETMIALKLLTDGSTSLLQKS